MPFANNKGVRLRWDEAGHGAPVFLVMGHRYSSALWYPVIPALAAEHRVVWFDNRGTGESDSTRKATLEDLADDAFAVMDAAGIERAHLFGVSMGGVIVQEMAMRAPQRVTSLIAGCTGILTADKPRLPGIVRLLYYLPPGVLKLLLSSRRADQGYGSAASPEAIAADLAILAKDKFVVSGVVAQAAAVAAYSTTQEAVAKLTMPSLVLHGDEDSVVPFKWGQELAEILPNSRFVKVEGAGHNVLVAGGEPIRQVIVDFLREVDERDRGVAAS
jgi:pimeloyl-ACP methyl ester carboxylesterase